MRVDDPAVHGRHVRDTGECACKRRQTACPKIVTLHEIELAVFDDSGQPSRRHDTQTTAIGQRTIGSPIDCAAAINAFGVGRRTRNAERDRDVGCGRRFETC